MIKISPLYIKICIMLISVKKTKKIIKTTSDRRFVFAVKGSSQFGKAVLRTNLSVVYQTVIMISLEKACSIDL